MNVARILAIFFAGNLWGERAAVDGLHPYLGLVTFNLGVVVMLLSMRRFGLDFRGAVAGGAGAPDGPAPETAVASAARTCRGPGSRIATLAVFGIGLAAINSGYRSYDLVASDLGSPKLVTFLGHPAPVDGWLATKAAEYSWARRSSATRRSGTGTPTAGPARGRRRSGRRPGDRGRDLHR